MIYYIFSTSSSSFLSTFNAISSYVFHILIDICMIRRYGLGSVFFRQEKYEMAEYHFRRALNINAVSSVLRCYLSMALHAQNDDNKSLEALDILIQACKVDPKNPQVRKREFLY